MLPFLRLLALTWGRWRCTLQLGLWDFKLILALVILARHHRLLARGVLNLSIITHLVWDQLMHDPSCCVLAHGLGWPWLLFAWCKWGQAGLDSSRARFQKSTLLPELLSVDRCLCEALLFVTRDDRAQFPTIHAPRFLSSQVVLAMRNYIFAYAELLHKIKISQVNHGQTYITEGLLDNLYLLSTIYADLLFWLFDKLLRLGLIPLSSFFLRLIHLRQDFVPTWYATLNIDWLWHMPCRRPFILYGWGLLNATH